MRKTLSFAAIHFTLAFSIAYLLTGDFLIGSLVAMLEPIANTFAFYFHEKIWLTPALSSRYPQDPKYKTASFACVHFSVAFSVTYLLTGDILLGSLMALIEPSCNTLAYYFHERVWQKRAKLALPAQPLPSRHQQI